MRQQEHIETSVHPSDLSIPDKKNGDESREERPLVSVIMNFLNPPEYFFREAIESVFAQTYGRWELLLVDDGSTEASTAFAQEYAQQFPDRVRYLEHPGHQNRGMSASRNLGIQQAKGTYVAFLDADDVWLPHKLEKQVAVLESYPEAAITFGGKIHWYSWNGEKGAIDKPVEIRLPHNTPLPPLTTIRDYVQWNVISGVCGILIRRDAAIRVGGFDESLTYCEDQSINYKISARYPTVVTPGQDWKYRRHPHSLSYTYRTFALDKKIALELHFLKWVSNFLKQNHIDDAGIWRDLYRTQRSMRMQLVEMRVSEGMSRQIRAIRKLFRSARSGNRALAEQ